MAKPDGGMGSYPYLTPTWQNNIRDLVTYGVQQFRSGRCDELRFNLFNQEEADLCAELMARHPDVPYSRSYIPARADAEKEKDHE